MAKESQAVRRKRVVADNKRRSAARQATARSKQLIGNTIRASKNSPLAVAGSSGSGGKKPPKTPVTTSSKYPRSTGGRSGKGKARGSKYVGGQTVLNKGRPALPNPMKSSAKGASKAIGGIGGKAAAVLAPLAAVAEVKATYDFKTDKSRPTVQSSGAAMKERRAKLKAHDFSKPAPATEKGGYKLKGKLAPGSSFPGKAKLTPAPATKTGTKTGGGRKSSGYSYTGPKVGSAEYKAMRAKKQAGYKAKARRNIAASRKGPASSKIKGVQHQQGTATPNYNQGNSNRQMKWTDNETTNQGLKSTAQRAQGDSGATSKRSKLYGVRKVLSAMGYAGEVR